jgi:FKBP-type peptidyl-prolyl cis-trans isomerase FkpA
MTKAILQALLFIVLVPMVFLSCDDNNLGKLRELELERLDQYIARNNITVKPTSSGLYYIEKQKGTGDTIKAGDVVDIYYRTWLIDSTLVDQNINAQGHFYDPLRFVVTPQGTSSTVVDGLNEGVKFMQLGTVSTMIVPSQIGYGQNGSGSIPAFSTLIFEVRIHKVVRGAQSTN